MRVCFLAAAAAAVGAASAATTGETACDKFAGNNADDCAFLTDLYEATNGAEWTQSKGWNTATSVCDWFGIECSEDGTRVNKTEVPANNLHGSIPASVGNTKLWGFDISGNKITGSIPAEIGGASTLWGANFASPVEGFGFTGSIPESFGQLTGLQLAGMPGNRLTGPIPDSLAALTDLRVLDVSGNQVTGVSAKLCGLVEGLQHCSLNDDPFECPIPACLVDHCNATCKTTMFLRPNRDVMAM